MVRFTIHLAEELHEKLRWVAYRERRSQHEIIIGLLEKAMVDVKVPEEAKE